MATTRFGVSIEDGLLKGFDRLLEEKGYRNRSEAIRDLIRDLIVNEQWDVGTEETAGTITLVYSHDTRELTDILTDIQHQYHATVVLALEVALERLAATWDAVIGGDLDDEDRRVLGQRAEAPLALPQRLEGGVFLADVDDDPFEAEHTTSGVDQRARLLPQRSPAAGGRCVGVDDAIGGAPRARAGPSGCARRAPASPGAPGCAAR